jgi:hypothetical protein
MISPSRQSKMLHTVRRTIKYYLDRMPCNELLKMRARNLRHNLKKG